MNVEYLRNLFLNEKFENCSYIAEIRRAFYGNICIACFKADNLKKCSACKLVSYCSREHQKEDWHNHKPICLKWRKVEEKVKYEGNCSYDEFTKYRKKLSLELGNDPVRPDFEREVYQFPWVCSFCYTRNNLQFECDNCNALVYCSLEHKEQDKIEHNKHCLNLKLCKLFDSLTFNEGFKLRLIKFTFEEIPRSVKFFPKSMKELSFIIQKQIRSLRDTHYLMNFIIHNDLYSSAATVLYALERIGILHKRIFTKKPFLTKRLRQLRLAERTAQLMAFNFTNLQINPAMVIHFVAAGSYEVNMQWTAFIALTTHWMLNIDYIEVVLVGVGLERCSQPDFTTLNARSGCQVCACAYKDVVKELIEPDMVVLFNYGHDKTFMDEFEDLESQRALFKYKRIPLLVTSTKEDTLKGFVDRLMLLPNVQVQVDTYKNPFAEGRPRRIWNNKNMSTYVRNEYAAILTRH